jgi:hypothetical protein
MFKVAFLGIVSGWDPSYIVSQCSVKHCQAPASTGDYFGLSDRRIVARIGDFTEVNATHGGADRPQDAMLAMHAFMMDVRTLNTLSASCIMVLDDKSQA